VSNHVESLEVVLNGQPHAIPRNCTLLALVRSLGLDPARVAVELDGEIVKRDRWDQTPLKAGARLELVHFVGGG
jgi:thiamine biosynthesis protein ThiS